MKRENDYLDEMVDVSCTDDPAYAAAWAPHALMLELSVERVRQGLTQEEVARRMGVGRPRIAQMENRPEGVSLARIARYAEAVGARLQVVPGDAPTKSGSRPGRSLATRTRRPAA